MSDKETKLEKEEFEKNKANEADKLKEDTQQKNKDMVPKQDYDELDDRYKRILAEFENYKKRSSKERESLYNSIL